MKILSLLVCLLATAFLKADTAWHTLTPIYQNSIFFRVEMPGIPVEKDLKTFHVWKSKAEGNIYYASIKARPYTREIDKIDIFDYREMLRYSLHPPVKLISSNDSIPGQSHFVVQKDDLYCYISVYFNEEVIIALMTKTAESGSLNHQHFIESFAFLK